MAILILRTNFITRKINAPKHNFTYPLIKQQIGEEIWKKTKIFRQELSITRL